jgi:hypothetical protein
MESFVRSKSEFVVIEPVGWVKVLDLVNKTLCPLSGDVTLNCVRDDAAGSTFEFVKFFVEC